MTTNSEPQLKYAIVIEQTPTGYSAYAPDRPGLGVAAESLAEVHRLIREGIEIYLDQQRSNGQAAPEPSTQVSYISLPQTS